MQLNEFTPAQVRAIIQNLHKLPPKEQRETLALLDELTERKTANVAKDSLLAFANKMAPALQIETEPKVFMVGPHHRQLAKLMDAVSRGEKHRILISVAPRFGKSLMSSYIFPAWYLGKFPNRRIIMASHTSDLATDFGRKVRDLIAEPLYQEVFPGVSLRADIKAAGKWATNAGGEYFAVGVGGALAGRGANLVIVDDPFSEQVVMAGNTDVFEDAWTWFQTGPLQRLAPDGACIIIHCMVGDTQVLLPDGINKNLRDIRVGDEVATYDNGRITKAKVLNWKNQGPDKVLAIKMKSGIIVRANERHPFLVQHGDRTEWTKVQNLKVGNRILRVTGENTEMSSVLLTAVASKLKPEACAPHTTTKLVGLLASVLHRLTQRVGAIITLSTDMGLVLLNMTPCLQLKKGYAPYVASRREVMYANTGVKNFASTTIMSQVKFAASCVMTAISLSGMERLKRYYSLQQNTCGITPDEIVSITSDGEEDVFDIQVEGTENFIANGLISHNTRWNKGDLIGRLINQMASNPEADQWDIIEFPAVLHADTPQAKSLWPERWSLEALLKKKANMAPQFWQAQYMQSPTSEAGALIKREWWKDWEKEEPPDCVYVIICLDAAQEAHTRADFNAFQAWGVFYDEKERANIIILDAWKKRMEFPELKKAMYAEYERWEPDTCLIEKKSSGSVLFQEMRAAGIPVSEFTPGKGQDKIARVNSVSDIFNSGLVWAPKARRWAMEVIEECSDFPNGEYDDQVDAMTLALRRFRTGGFIKLDMDEEDEAAGYQKKRKYY